MPEEPASFTVTRIVEQDARVLATFQAIRTETTLKAKIAYNLPGRILPPSYRRLCEDLFSECISIGNFERLVRFLEGLTLERAMALA